MTSQAMIFSSWSDAKAGTAANLILLVAVIHGYASWGPASYRAEYHRRARSALADLATKMRSAAGMVTDADLAHLPAPVAAYVRQSGAVGQPRVASFRARIHGRIRGAPDKPWMKFTSYNPHSSLAQEAEMNAVQPYPSVDDAGGFPRDGTEEQIWQFLLRYAVRAPSGHNTQPWRFHIAERRLRLYADRSRALAVVDPEDRELVMSCGAALAHLIVALRHFGYAGDVSEFPDRDDRDLLATVGLGQAHTPRPGDHQLFEAIDKWHAHCSVFEARPVAQEVLAQLGRDIHHAGANLHVLTGDGPRAAIAALVGEGDRSQFDDAGFRHELAAWIHPNRTRRPDGMPGYAFGISDLVVLGLQRRGPVPAVRSAAGETVRSRGSRCRVPARPGSGRTLRGRAG
ncbi:Acg family FMN-binding oxidoreductase [Myceligenerans halotolerans]